MNQEKKRQIHKEGNDQKGIDEKFWREYQVEFTNYHLPSFLTFDQAYPKTNGGLMQARQVFELIGGEVNDPNYINACAARVSRALNYSNVKIPNIQGVTFKGADDKYYFLGARNLYEWLKKVFGTPNVSLTQAQCRIDGSGFKNIVNGKKGIYLMIPNYPAQFGASGHADIFYGNTFNGEGYFDPEGGLYRANLWVLQ